MAHLQHLPGDPRLVDQLVYELKSKGIFDQFRKECIADVDTRPAYQNLRQRVENSVTTFLAHQCWQPDLNKNQLREKLRKHILDGNFEQGVERIVDQVVNPKVASVFIPQVEDLVYNYLGITRKKSTPNAETSKEKSDTDSLLPTDLEAVSPGSVKSNDDKNDIEIDLTDDITNHKMEIDNETSKDITLVEEKMEQDSKMSTDVILQDNDSIDKSTIPLPSEGIKLESIPHPKNSPPKIEDSKIELEKIELPKNIKPALSEIPLPDEIPKADKNNYFKPVNTDEDESSSDSSLRRNMSPLTPVRNFDNDNSCDAQQAFDNDLNSETKEPSSFRFAIDSKSAENSSDAVKPEKKEAEHLSHQFNNQVNINAFNTPMYDDSSNSNLLHIDYESDANSKIPSTENKVESEQNSEDCKKEKKPDDKKPSHRSSHHSRDSHRHSSSKDKRSDSKHSTSRDSSRHDKKSSSKDDGSKSKSSHKDNSKERSDRKDDSSKHKSSHKSSSKDKDSKTHKSSSSSRNSSKHDDRKSSTSSSRDKEKDKSSEKSSREKSSKESRSSSSHRSSKDDRKKSSSSSSSSSKKPQEKDKDKKEKKETDDHYSLSGRGNVNRRSTDRDSNDGSSSSKGSHNVSSAKSSTSKKDGKSSSSKSGSTSTSSETSPSDKDKTPVDSSSRTLQPVVRVENHLETPFASPPRLPFVPDVTMKKPKIASNMEEARKMMKMRRFLEEEQKRMNQEAALLLEFQANVRPSLSQVYSSIPGPELEFACMMSSEDPKAIIVNNNETKKGKRETQVEQDSKTDELDEAETIEVSVAEDSNDDGNLVFEELTVEQQLENIYAASYGEEENDNNKNIELATKMNTLEETTSENDTTEEISAELSFVSIDSQIMDKDELENILGKNESQVEFEVTIVSEESDDELVNTNESEVPLEYFTESDKLISIEERNRFGKFLKTYLKKSTKSKMFLVNCDPYEENLFREVAKTEGDYEIVNYIKNGHLKLSQNTNKNVVKDINVTKEIVLPVESKADKANITKDIEIFSPIESECSFELSSDYETKIDDIVNKTSRQEIMEIILGNVEQSPSKMPEINYYNETAIEGCTENSLKRKMSDVDTGINNNLDDITTPNKMRKASESEQISSTTEEPAATPEPSNKTINNARSKYLIKARRVGLPKPKRTDIPNSPSSDQSVENYEQIASKPQTPNGKIKTVPRNKIQRYDTSDLYKPKLHYLSRRNHIT